ncbi:chalcone synthase-like protein [Corchorus olitorius]|uniref:Chalcone synthase-like protein n=1 Tax=Corchorus olitorius TaxID=93759 RepID=A0A1R3KEH1_9ROSI|nr:chalcone synthase-like protein [Corchorus olitorius]
MTSIVTVLSSCREVIAPVGADALCWENAYYKTLSVGKLTSAEATLSTGKLASAEETHYARKYIRIANKCVLVLFGFGAKAIVPAM